RRAEGVGLEAMAIFYRTNAQSRVLEDAIRAVGLPYHIVGSVRFYARREVKDALAYLRLALNPSDDLAFTRAITVPPRGIGKTTLARLGEAGPAAPPSLRGPRPFHLPAGRRHRSAGGRARGQGRSRAPRLCGAPRSPGHAGRRAGPPRRARLGCRRRRRAPGGASPRGDGGGRGAPREPRRA